MKHRLPLALALIAAIGAPAVLAVRADAQQTPPPAADQRGPDGANAFGRGPDRMGPRGGMMRGSPEDRAAFFDARIAAVKAGLRLTPDQEKLWPPLEQAIRDNFRTITDRRRTEADQPRPADPVERMRRRADDLTSRGESLRKMADAAAPLYASLSDEQKRRLPRLMRLGPDDRGGPEEMRRRMRRGEMDRRRHGFGFDRERFERFGHLGGNSDDFASEASNDRRL